MEQILGFLTAPIPLWGVLSAAIAALFFGGLLSAKFGSNWLKIIGFLFDSEDIGMLATIVWRSDLLPAWYKETRWRGDEAAFVEAMIEKATDLSSVFASLVDAVKTVTPPDTTAGESDYILEFPVLKLNGRDTFTLK